jgi:ABC-2 type transport system permease protein
MMRPSLAIAGRDVRGAFGSPIGYGLVAGFLALAGVLLVVALRDGEARLDGWFAPLLVMSGVLAALVTMRSFAEEERAGTLELLLTSPLRPWQVVAGKFVGAASVFGLVIAGTLAAPLLLASLGDPDVGPIVTGYLGYGLAGLAFVAVGVAASAATSSQLAAAAATAGLLLGLWFSAGVTSTIGGVAGTTLTYLSPSTHVTGFLRGTLAPVDVVYFGTMVVAGLAVATALVRVRR